MNCGQQFTARNSHGCAGKFFDNLRQVRGLGLRAQGYPNSDCQSWRSDHLVPAGAVCGWINRCKWLISCISECGIRSAECEMSPGVWAALCRLRPLKLMRSSKCGMRNIGNGEVWVQRETVPRQRWEIQRKWLISRIKERDFCLSGQFIPSVPCRAVPSRVRRRSISRLQRARRESFWPTISAGH
jgi:hypothetical protein